MPSSVKLIEDIVVDADFLFQKPFVQQDGSRFSSCVGPYVQTSEMPVSLGKDNSTIICTDAYADFIAQVEDHAIETLSQMSQPWFQRDLSYDDVEHMIKASIKGHRVPKHCVASKSVKCYDHALEAMSEYPKSGTHCVCIMKVDGVKLDEKRAEVLFSLQQVKCLDAVFASETPELEGPAFV